jgi:hypothetical protein
VNAKSGPAAARSPEDLCPQDQDYIITPCGSVKAAALNLAAKGIAVFPCVPRGPRSKAPLTEHGHLDASCDPDLIDAWWNIYPAAMIGSPVPNDLIVLDVDPRNGGDIDDLGPLPPTLTVWSGRDDGGRHLYFQRPDGPLTSTRLPAGVDLKSNGYCILPPSIHPASGKAYRWEWREPAGLPRRLLALLRPVAPRPRESHDSPANGVGLIRNVLTAEVGTRNRALYWSACRAVADNIVNDLEEELVNAALSVGLSEREARATINSARRSAP